MEEGVLTNLTLSLPVAKTESLPCWLLKEHQISRNYRQPFYVSKVLNLKGMRLQSLGNEKEQIIKLFF